MRRLLALACSAAAALAFAGAASAFTKSDQMLAMDDGISIATTLYLPDGAPPATGWPTVMMFHGLGGRRTEMNVLAETWFVPKGYAVFTADARGHGDSGGVVTIDGPREVADVKALYGWVSSQPGIDTAHIGSWGVSYGGGIELRALVEHVPFASVETFETWSDLYAALVPNNLSKSGVVFGFLNNIRANAISELIQTTKGDLLGSTNLPALKALLDERSSLSALSQVTTPVFMAQGRRDFAFDMGQMTRAYAVLKGPKRLYLGNLGHPPSTFLSDDFQHFMTEAVQWEDRFLKGQPNGIDTQLPVELAPNPFRGKTVSFKGLPPTKTLKVRFPGSATINQEGKIVRTVSLPRVALEQFGSAVVRATVSSKTGFPHLVAVLSALPPKGSEILLEDGGTQTAVPANPRLVSFPLASNATLIPAGSKLRITLASNSSVQNPANLVYLQTPLPPGSSVTVGKVTVDLRLLKTPISK